MSISIVTDRSPLQLLCLCLSDDPAVRGNAIAALSAPEAREAVVTLAATERLLPALYESASAFPEHLPKAERIPLALRYEANRRRNRQIREAVLELAAEANRHSIEIIALKGAMWVMEDPVDFAAWRSMDDIDILVDPKDLATMRDVLSTLGYRPTRRESNFLGRGRFDGHYHLVAHRRANEPYFVEVHRHVSWRTTLLPNELIFESRREIAPGLSVPCPWHAALNAIIHWQIHHYGFQQGLELVRDGMEIARFLNREDVDWDRLSRHVARSGIRREFEAALAVATEMFGARLPNALPPSQPARAYVVRALQIRESRTAAWKAKQHQRILRLWDDQRFVYRMNLRNVHPFVTHIGLWALRLRRLPFIVAHLFSIGLLQTAMRVAQLFRPDQKAH